MKMAFLFSHPTRRPSRGFTLIELLVVIAIIGLLSSVVLASVDSARVKSRDVRRLGDVRAVMTALELYYDRNNAYPQARNASGVLLPDGTGGQLSSTVTYDLVGMISGSVNDPLFTGADNYRYVHNIGPEKYGIRIRFENRAGTDANGYCKTGVNIITGWWGATTPVCQ